MQLELKNLQKAYTKTYKDLQEFVTLREKHHWCTWDNWKEQDYKQVFQKPSQLPAIQVDIQTEQTQFDLIIEKQDQLNLLFGKFE